MPAAIKTRYRNLTQTGIGISATAPVGVSASVSASIRNVATLSESWLAASGNSPDGSIAKLRGVMP